MAGMSGSEIAAIHQQIQEFPDAHSDFMEAGAAPSEVAVGRSTARRANKTKHTDAEIQQLEADIKDLEKKILQQREQHKLHQAWQNYHTHHSPEDTNTDIVHAQIEGLKYQNEDLTANSRITNLSISTSDNMHKDLKNTVEKFAKEGNAQGFLCLLQPYSRWLTARETTFQHFVTKYPKIAERKSTQELHMNHPNKQVTFIVQWTFKVTDICSVVPDLQLTIQVPKNVSLQNNVLRTAPETFQLMCKELGIEKAIHSLLLLLME